MVDQDLSRLYPEHGSYFQTPGCQGLLRRVLLLWCLRHPECGYRQGKLFSQAIFTDADHWSVRLNYVFSFWDGCIIFPSNSI